ncbi:uncharacterized protein LOC110840682 isoform X2 [Zootermopsis nevadensis]|uniref:uncharacterized protein LOC110840682 isoform X2 n=1 Tax=Zootermopsis nevadensis TaxID=136037 RepID=UPI000B8E625D|nr:uncharacterized protein LOC110840682 isoform X2 [Zootermopsis nevadensis]
MYLSVWLFANLSKLKMPKIVTLPELTELDRATALMTENRGDGSGSGTESDSDDTIPELEEPGTGQTSGVFPGATAAGLPMDMVSKAKQSSGEKKACKIMSKLGLKPIEDLNQQAQVAAAEKFKAPEVSQAAEAGGSTAVTPATTLYDGVLPMYKKRRGSSALHRELYVIRVASFLFAQGLYKSEEFHLASNVDFAEDFDDVVFKYRLKGQDICKTCFIQLKHKETKNFAIPRTSLLHLSGDFSLLKYFASYCQIKRNVSKDSNLKMYGSFVDFEFIIYTNARLNSKRVHGDDSGPLSILRSGPNNGKYVTFNERNDEDIFHFFKKLKQYYRLPPELKYLETCDFSLDEEFLQKVKIFQCQANESSLEKLIKKKLEKAFHTSSSGINSIYEKLERYVTQWWKQNPKANWLSESSRFWQTIRQHWIQKIKELSKIDVQESIEYGMRFTEQHVQPLSEALQCNKLLKVITKKNCGTLSKLKIYQALNSLGQENSLFISLKTLMDPCVEILEFWPCKWSSVLVIDCKEGSDDEKILAKIFTGILDLSHKKCVVISRHKHPHLAFQFQQKPVKVYAEYEDECNFFDLDNISQEIVLKRTVDL